MAAGWGRYRAGEFAVAGGLVAIAVQQAAASWRAAPVGEQGAACGVLADAYRLAAYVANQFGVRDLAYAAIGHARHQADRAGDPVRGAMVASGRSWIYLRDSRLEQAVETAERSYLTIEPRYADRDLKMLATYGWYVTFAAVVAARSGDVGRADDLLSQGERCRCPDGPGRADQRDRVRSRHRSVPGCRDQRLDRPAGKALEVFASMGDQSVLTPSARNRLMLDVALAQCDTRQWDASLDTLLEVCTAHPD